MTGRERIIKALNHQIPDFVPVTIHQFMPGFRQKYFINMSNIEVNRKFGLDIFAYFGDNYLDKQESITLGLGEPIVKETGDDSQTEEWQFQRTVIEDKGEWVIARQLVKTPKGEIEQIIQESTKNIGEQYWVKERPIKEKNDVEKLKYRPVPEINVERCRNFKNEVGDNGIIRGGVWDIWAEASELVSPQKLILESIKDPKWVFELLDVIYDRTRKIVDKLPDSIDLIELYATDCSSALISPKIYEKFILPYAKKLVAQIKSRGFFTSYHICGKVMALIDLIAETGTTALETLAPKELHGDADLKVIKDKIGDKICMIGGFDQVNVLERGDKELIFRKVKECIDAAASGGGYILMPSDHFWDAPPENIEYYVKAARQYGDYINIS